jgi:hypothetical protein
MRTDINDTNCIIYYEKKTYLKDKLAISEIENSNEENDIYSIPVTFYVNK